MLFIDNQDNHEPALNLALEEYCALNWPQQDSYFLLYVNSPCLVLGKNQNTLEEINHRFAKAQNIDVLRRISGGGTVYHDLGNINFSFICPHDQKKVANFRWFNEPVCAALNDLGVPAEINKRGDLIAEGRKISGNAQYTSKRMMFSHGTLLFDSNLEYLERALDVCIGRVESKSMKSVRSKVQNIKPYLSPDWTLPLFKSYLAEKICGINHASISPTSTEWAAIHDLAQSKYKSWEWNFGRSPECSIQKEANTNRPFALTIQLASGCIFKDFEVLTPHIFSEELLNDLRKVLSGVPYESSALLQVLEKYFQNPHQAQEWLDWLF
ncbi:MAG: lipoate--protein ligase [Cytophagales bacterium]|nr:MAG: lipoate--protein ligase [Cytophagales bacterium]TAF60155.1 MAG: lipoate--protein ligase [Cytophagales bacterium]